MRELVFLKLGGSLITNKTQPYTARLDVLTDLSQQIAHALQSRPDLLLILGHGSGSFGHTAAKKNKTRDGINSIKTQQEYWKGFSEVWNQASTLNRYVVQTLLDAGIPAMTFSPAANVWAENGQVDKWDISQIKRALENGIVPVVHGDVIFDRKKGGTILSTEELFEHLAKELHPARILLAGLEEGVWADFPVRKHKVQKVTRESFEKIRQSAGEAVGADVTGGMESKVKTMLELAEAVPRLSVQIFSGEKSGNLEKVLLGEHLGTIVEL
jgi:isopentenyl phosphate kinase